MATILSSCTNIEECIVISFSQEFLNTDYLRPGGYVFAWVCLWVCEFVRLFVNKITQKLMDRF